MTGIKFNKKSSIRFLIVGILIVFVGSTISIIETNARPPTFPTYTGYVKTAGGTPIKNAIVRLFSEGWQVSISYTNDNGYYCVGNDYVYNPYLRVEKTGFLTQTKSVSTKGGVYNFFLISTGPYATYNGYVYDEHGCGISNALITLYSEGIQVSTDYTDASGYYCVGNDYIVTPYLKVEKAKYVTQTKSVSTVGGTYDFNMKGLKYAVIVGISDYKSIGDLSYCDEDATDWYNYLISVGYNSDNIKVLGDTHTENYPIYTAQATESNIKYWLNWLCNLNAMEILFITSGHGNGDGEGSSYLDAWDSGSGESGEDGKLYDTELATIFSDTLATKVFIFVDHCYSGGLISELSDALGNKLYMTTTCTENGKGYDYRSAQNGAWTHFFLEYALIDYYSSSINTAMENAFSYALAAYPYSGSDTPQQQDNYFGYFTL